MRSISITEVGIYKKKENKKTRKRSRKKEKKNGQEKKKENTPSTKKVTKNKRNFFSYFLDRFPSLTSSLTTPAFCVALVFELVILTDRYIDEWIDR